jgi:hypothetical protein
MDDGGWRGGGNKRGHLRKRGGGKLMGVRGGRVVVTGEKRGEEWIGNRKWMMCGKEEKRERGEQKVRLYVDCKKERQREGR